MITAQDMERLTRGTTGGSPVVSLYLNVDGAMGAPAQYAVRADALARTAGEQMARQGYDAAASTEARTDLDRVTAYVRDTFTRDSHRGLALFASSAQGLWRVFPLADPVRDRLVIAPHPYIRSLALYLEQDPRYAVLILRRETAWFFLLNQGEITDQEEWKDDVPGRIRPGSWYGLADKRIERHVDNAIHQHLKRAAALLDDRVRRSAIPRILLGGTEDVVTEFQRTLPRRLRARVIGQRLPEPPVFTAAHVRDQAREALHATERAEHAALIAEVLEEAGRGRYSVVGLEATLAELHRGAVQTLVAAQERVAPGFICESCGRLFTTPPACPVCAAPVEAALPVQDIVEEAVDAALRDGGDVVFVEPTPEWARRGGIGATLRFPGVAPLS